MKKKKNTLMSLAKDTVGLGVGSMVGIGAMGAISNVPGMPSQAGNVVGTASAGLNLANIGNMANIGMNIIPKTGKKGECGGTPRVGKKGDMKRNKGKYDNVISRMI